MRYSIVLACLLTLASTHAALAQKDPAKIDDLYVDFAIPDVPALGLFGVAPSKVARPGNLKEFSLALLPLSAGDERIGAGVAMSWAPVYTVAKSLDDYANGWARRLAISAATVKDSKSSTISLAVGARIILHDGSDPLLDQKFKDDVSAILRESLKSVEARNAFWNDGPFSSMLNDVVGRMTPDVEKQAQLKLAFMDNWDILSPPARVDAPVQVRRFQQAINGKADAASGINAIDLATIPALQANVQAFATKYVDIITGQPLPPTASKTKLTALRKKYLEKHWNYPVLSVDVGHLSASATGVWGDLKSQKLGFSFSSALPAGRSGQLVLEAQGRKGLRENSAEEWFYSGGGRLLLGSATKRVSVEGVFSKARDVDAARNGVTKRATIGTEFRLAQGFWVEVATGSEWLPEGAGQPGASLISLASLKYAFKSKARFSEIPGADEDQ